MAYPSTKGKKLGDSPVPCPRPGVPLSKEIMMKLIAEEHGNLSRVADRMGTTRYTIRDRCNADQELMKALDDARERKLDRLEDSVWRRAEESNDTGLQCFILKTQGRHRGYDQDEQKNAAKDIATAAFDFIIKKQQEQSKS